MEGEGGPLDERVTPVDRLSCVAPSGNLPLCKMGRCPMVYKVTLPDEQPTRLGWVAEARGR